MAIRGVGMPGLLNVELAQRGGSGGAATPDRALLPRFTVPALPPGLVPRPRLHDLIKQGEGGPLTVVSAPAGTGKTIAVANWLSQRRGPGPVVWISLTDRYLATEAFWSLVVAGLSHVGVASQRNPPVTAPLTATLAAQIADHPDPVTLILDCDIDLSHDVATGLHHMLRDAGGRLRLVVLSRSDPLLPLHLYRLDGGLVEIRMADLAFTTAEARDLLAGRGVELAPAVLDIVMARTCGWVAGLLLSAMFLIDKDDPERAAREFSGSSGTVAEYLLSEMLNAQTPSMRQLLLRTCVVELLRPGLSEALAGAQAQRALTFLERGNALLEAVPGTPGWYRYHPLFRDLLVAQLAYESPGEPERLHRVASQWLAGEGLIGDAVRHAVAARCWGDAARYVVDDLALPEVMYGRRGVLREPLLRLPDDVPGPNPALVRAAVAFARHDLARCGGQLERARDQLDVTSGPAVLGLAILTAAHAAAIGDHAAALRAVADALPVLAKQDPARLAARPEVTATVQVTRARALVRAGRLGEGAAAYTAAATGTWRPGLKSGQADCLAHLALTAAWGGQSRKAIRLVEQAVAVLADVEVRPEASCRAALDVALAWAYADRYDLRLAEQHAIAAERSHALAAEAPGGQALADDAMPRIMLAMVRSRICRAHGDADGARAAVVGAREIHAPTWLADELRVEEAVVETVAGRPARAAQVLGDGVSGPAHDDAELVRAQARLADGQVLDRPLPDPDEQNKPLSTRVDTWLVEALHRLQGGDEQRAADALDRSLRLAAPERLRRPFREAPPDVRRLLRTRPELLARHDWLAGPGSWRLNAPRQPVAPAPVIVEPLTQKEKEVLGHLAELLTTEEIAAAMFVSVNTIRTHVRNILRKLAVSRRNEAIRRARELNILPR